MPYSRALESHVIDAIYRGACDDEQLFQALRELCRLVDGACAVLGEVHFAGPPLELIPVGDLDPYFLRIYPNFAQFDPMPRAVMAVSEGHVVNSVKAFPEEDRRRNPFVNEMLIPSGLSEAVSLRNSSGDGHWASLSILQAAHRDPFDETVEAILARIGPHIGRATQIRRLLKEQQQRAGVLGSILDRSNTGIIASPPDGAAAFVNAAARSMASAGDGFGLDRHGQPIIADREAAKRFSALRADVSAGGAGGTLRLRRPSGRPPYLVLVARLPDDAGAGRGERRGVLITIHDPATHATFSSSLVAEVLDLPKATANLVCALLHGEDLRDYGMRSGVSLNTVRYHLKTAFARTGAHSQAELIRNALLALHELMPHPDR